MNINWTNRVVSGSASFVASLSPIRERGKETCTEFDKGWCGELNEFWVLLLG